MSILTGEVAAVAAPVTDMLRQGWTKQDGAPRQPVTMERGPDGYLWIGTADGLFRFDGLVFERMEPPASKVGLSVRSLAFDRSGTLWVGYGGSGGLGQVRGGRVVDMNMPDPPREVSFIIPDRKGDIWLIGARPRQAITRLTAGKWQTLPDSWSVPDGWIYSAIQDRDGTLWIGQVGKLSYLPPGGRKFAASDFPVSGTAYSLDRDPHGDTWLLDGERLRKLPRHPWSGEQVRRTIPLGRPVKAQIAEGEFDAAGDYWLTERHGGLARIRTSETSSAEEKVQTFGAVNGLSADDVGALFRDREGSLWIGTSSGLDKFRIARVRATPIFGGGTDANYAMAADGRGSIYVSSVKGLFYIAPDREPQNVRGVPGPTPTLCPTLDGDAWAITSHNLMRLHDGVAVKVAPVSFAQSVAACHGDNRGAVWVALYKEGVVLWDGQRWRQVKLPASFAPSEDVQVTRGVGVTMNLDHQELLIIKDGRWRHYTLHDLKLNRLTAVTPIGPNILLSGPDRLAEMTAKGIRYLTGVDIDWLNQLKDLQVQADGMVWALGRVGILRFRLEDLQRALVTPGLEIPHTVFDEADGFDSFMQKTSGPQIAQGKDGRVWILARGGVYRITPERLTLDPQPPPVAIRALEVSSKHLADAARSEDELHTSPSLTDAGNLHLVDPANVSLKAGTTALAIRFAALSLAVPSRVRVLYRLEGVDSGWIEAGRRRQAFYTNLGPGSYRFRVIAANADGIWNRQGASLDFVIPPTFTQSWQFRVLCALVAALALAFAYRRHVRGVARNVRRQELALSGERERIARDIHDTLLQGFQALLLKFQLATDRIEPASETRATMEKAIAQADGLLVESRREVQMLRAHRGKVDLVQRLEDLALADRGPGAVKVTFQSDRSITELSSEVANEVVAIAREAVLNAVRHAEASMISLKLRHHARVIEVLVEDDGRGLPEHVREAGGAHGHFGLIGIRERAAKISAEITIARRATRGTLVSLLISHQDRRDLPARVSSLFRWRSGQD